MKPFNLEDYLANPSRKVVTRDGRAVTRFLCTDAKGDYPIVALVEKSDRAVEEPLSYTKNGYFYLGEKHPCDLFFTPEKHEGWVNLYRTETSSQYVTSNLYNSEEKAIEIGRTSENYIATIKIEWEE